MSATHGGAMDADTGGQATHGQAVATALSSGAASAREPLVVTALFEGADAVDRALDALYTAGTPRDLIEVVVSREAAQRYYADARRPPRPPGRETWRYAGAGGLLGFLGGVGISLLMVAWPGIEAPGGLALVQLAGPNLGTIVGAAAGAVIGASRRQRPDARHARAAEASGMIVLAVNTRGQREAQVIGELLAGQGGSDVRAETA